MLSQKTLVAGLTMTLGFSGILATHTIAMSYSESANNAKDELIFESVSNEGGRFVLTSSTDNTLSAEFRYLSPDCADEHLEPVEALPMLINGVYVQTHSVCLSNGMAAFRPTKSADEDTLIDAVLNEDSLLVMQDGYAETFVVKKASNYL